MDGTMIATVPTGLGRKEKRPRDWKEMRLGAAQAKGCTQAHHSACFLAVDEAGNRWGHCAREAGWSQEARIHVVADGAEWIALQSREVFGDQADLLVDFYHVSEYLAAAAQACRPASPRAWLHTSKNASSAVPPTKCSLPWPTSSKSRPSPTIWPTDFQRQAKLLEGKGVLFHRFDQREAFHGS